jgi:hypothetical protein
MSSTWRFVFHQEEDDPSDPGGVSFLAPSTYATLRDQPLEELVAEWNEANPDSPLQLKKAEAVL